MKLLIRSDLRDHHVGYDESRYWPTRDRNWLLNLGILRRIEDAEYLACEVCGDGTLGEVHLDIGPEPRIHCEAHGLMRVRPERLQRWRLDFAALGAAIRGALKLTGSPEVVTPGRIWLLGRQQLGKTSVEFFLIRGVAWSDNLELLMSAPRLTGSRSPIFMCPHQLPTSPEWARAGRASLRLSEWAHLEQGQLQIEFAAFAEVCVREEDPAERALEPTPVVARAALLRKFCSNHGGATVGDVAAWAGVDRSDLNKWKLGKEEVPDGGARAHRIEQLLQRGIRVRG